MAKKVVVHEDDVGMNHGANAAFAELFASGACTSGSVMVPCPWFLEVAQLCRDNPAVDMGVHLVLTSEFEHYRWRPLTRPGKESGLVDDDGFFHARSPAVRAQARPEAVEDELRLQVETAIAAGIDPTHLDAHMFAAVAPEIVDIYARLGAEFRLPVVMTKDLTVADLSTNLGPIDDAAYAAVRADLVARGNPLFDALLETGWTRAAGVPALPDYEAMLRKVPDGLTWMALHFNAPGEIGAIDPGRDHIRTDELDVFRDPSFLALFNELGIERIGMREIRDAMRAG